MKQLHPFTLAALSLLLNCANAQNINYFGVAYSPYVKSDGSQWNSYTLDDIKKMLRIALKYHNSISTYSMGVADYNLNGPWDRADSNCLIARAAAQINRESNAVVLSVSQGIYQSENPNVMRKEIDNAFLAAQDANGIRPGTVWGLVFTNEYVSTTDLSRGQRVLQMIRDNRARARQSNLRIGTRIHLCGEIWDGANRNTLIEIAKISDFIMCNLYPAPNTNNADAAVQQVSDGYYSARDGFWRHNPNLEVIIGETGWASEGRTFNNPPEYNTLENMRNFWNRMRDWSGNKKVKVQMFEAFDEPWKGGEGGEKHFGWWKRAPDNSNYYIEKVTGRRFD